METIRINELSDDVRAFLDRAFAGNGVLVEDERGRARGGVVPYFEADDAEKRRAWEGLKQLQQRVAASLQRQGITEDDLDRVLQEDD
jgi:hypothetical protein